MLEGEVSFFFLKKQQGLFGNMNGISINVEEIGFIVDERQSNVDELGSLWMKH